MEQVKVLVDDSVGCNTQRAVLSAFVSELRKNKSLSVIEMSKEPLSIIWSDVPAESSRQLALRLFAFQSKSTMTVFLPGHIIPGRIDSANTFHSAICANNFRCVSGLDISVIRHAHKDVQFFLNFVDTHPNYNSVGGYENFNVERLPAWLVAGGLISALDICKRPWYFAQTPARIQWLYWVRKAIDQGLLNIQMVENDVSKGVVRPSLLSDVKQLILGVENPLIQTTVDSFFTPPESALNCERLQILNSEELQQRAIKYFKNKGLNAKAGSNFSTLGLIKKIKRAIILIRRQIMYLRRKS